MTHKEAVNIAYRWVLANASCGIAFKELVTVSRECADVIGFGGWDHSVLIEVKVSRSDFLCDKKKPFRINSSQGMGKYRYYCCPTGLIKVVDLPWGWGLIYINEKGKATCVHRPTVRLCDLRFKNEYSALIEHDYNKFSERAIMYSALRRLHLRGRLPEIYDATFFN